MLQSLLAKVIDARRAPADPPRATVTRPVAELLTSGPSASVSHLVAPHLAACGLGIEWVDWAAALQASAATPASMSVVVRYLCDGSSQAVRKLRQRSACRVYFMDDDLMDPEAVAELPEPYRSRVRRDALNQRRAIEALCTEFWVSTPYLAQKYAAWNPRLLEPRPERASLTAQPSVWVCYHGTASHQAEFDWLLPLIRQVQQAASGTRFEVFGDHAVYKRFRELPRVNVLHPMSWPNYLDYTLGVQRQIGLAPLLPSRFNAGRGPTKFFDFARMGAVGIYSDVAPYRGFVRHGVDGLLLPNDAARWAQAITGLVADRPAREAMAAAARSRSLELAY